MQKRFIKYFWDGAENISEEFKLKRIIEYASFPDLINYSFDSIKMYIDKIDVDKLHTDWKRKVFLGKLTMIIRNCRNWNEVFEKMIN